jgi:hypothetical protein
MTDPVVDLRKQIIWAHAMVAALALYYAWRDEYDVAEQWGDRPCRARWEWVMTKTVCEWRRG